MKKIKNFHDLLRLDKPRAVRQLDRKTDKNGECWIYTGAKNNKGYGWFWGEGAHRASWIINRGSIPDGVNVCHRCDNPPCIRPDHLFLGTQSENLKDAFAKGRGPRYDTNGERNPAAKLTWAIVRSLRVEFAVKRTPPVRLAEIFNVDKSTVQHILAGYTWNDPKHVPLTRKLDLTKCWRGHDLDEENTYRDKKSGKRACRICLRAAQARYNEKRKLNV